jgi:L-lactate dehydrogenase
VPGWTATRPSATAEVLVEGDLLGHTTHGLALLPAYLDDVEKQKMTRTGEPEVIADFPAAVTWDGKRLPGPWLVRRGLQLASERARHNGTCAVSIRRSHHIACLGAYLRPLAEDGFMVLLSSSDPTGLGVAPHGGRTQVIDARSDRRRLADRRRASDHRRLDVHHHQRADQAPGHRGRKFPALWALDAAGTPHRRSGARVRAAAGCPAAHGLASITATRGFALALLVEAADRRPGWLRARGSSGGLGRHGVPAGVRSEAVRRSGCVRAADRISGRRCRAVPARPGFERVRLPGETGPAGGGPSSWRTGSSSTRRSCPLSSRGPRSWAVPLP